MKPTLDEFLATSDWPFSAYVIHPDFKDLYVRKTDVVVCLHATSVVCDRVVTIANVTAKKPGQGSFTRLVDDLVKKDLAIYVECAHERFGFKLLKMGFIKCSLCEGAQNYVFNFKNHLTQRRSTSEAQFGTEGHQGNSGSGQ